MNNLAELLTHRRATSGAQRFGIAGATERFDQVYDRAARLAGLFGSLGVAPGDCVAVIGSNSASYLTTYLALQLSGAETALINPSYPAELLSEMLRDLLPAWVVWAGPEPSEGLYPDCPHIDARAADAETLIARGVEHAAPGTAGELPGLGRFPGDIAGYMHTSGTTGTPKFCAQTHEYFLRMGRFVADSMGLYERDTVFAPLPMFHVNPLGYGMIGSLVAGAGLVTTPRFSASRFWDEVRDNDVTALILHAPPVEILKRATTREHAAGHQVRITFFADEAFMSEFGIPVGVSGYGSTEAGGFCHVWLWRRGDDTAGLPLLSRYAGRSRPDVRWRLSGDGEIEIAGTRPGVLFEGYRKGNTLIRPFDEDGWFATGDLGRIDEAGNLIFLDRRAESIRVKGEFVPIDYVEDHFAQLPGVSDVAVWRHPSELTGDEVALYVVGEGIDVPAVQAAAAQLPAFMQPRIVIRTDEIPRGGGVGKKLRRNLDQAPRLEQAVLS